MHFTKHFVYFINYFYKLYNMEACFQCGI